MGHQPAKMVCPLQLPEMQRNTPGSTARVDQSHEQGPGGGLARSSHQHVAQLEVPSFEGISSLEMSRPPSPHSITPSREFTDWQPSFATPTSSLARVDS